MATVEEGVLRFTFPDGWVAEKYDDWAQYRESNLSRFVQVRNPWIFSQWIE